LADRAIVVEGYRFRQSGEFYLAVFEDFILTADTEQSISKALDASGHGWGSNQEAYDSETSSEKYIGAANKPTRTVFPKS
jgi:hypothetical protein